MIKKPWYNEQSLKYAQTCHFWSILLLFFVLILICLFDSCQQVSIDWISSTWKHQQSIAQLFEISSKVYLTTTLSVSIIDIMWILITHYVLFVIIILLAFLAFQSIKATIFVYNDIVHWIMLMFWLLQALCQDVYYVCSLIVESFAMRITRIELHVTFVASLKCDWRTIRTILELLDILRAWSIKAWRSINKK